MPLAVLITPPDHTTTTTSSVLPFLQVLCRVHVTLWPPHTVLVEGTSPAHTNIHGFHQQQASDENGPTIAFRVTEPNSVSALSEEIRTEQVTDCEKPDQGVCVLSSDSGDSNHGSTLHSAVSRYSAVSALQCGHHIQF
ncbi:hypothetical protein J6590_102323 [Homalodisca vitripennis]|nr:hypothetical protein J6590_102323 [Homalodisca vitripennis]